MKTSTSSVFAATEELRAEKAALAKKTAEDGAAIRAAIKDAWTEMGRAQFCGSNVPYPSPSKDCRLADDYLERCTALGDLAAQVVRDLANARDNVREDIMKLCNANNY